MSDYARKKIYEAVDSLVGASTMRKRLEYAFRHLVILNEQDFPEEFRSDFSQIMSASREYQDPDQGSIVASVAKMSEEQAEAMSKRILSLYVQLRGGI